jgi:hypothetical protein
MAILAVVVEPQDLVLNMLDGCKIGRLLAMATLIVQPLSNRSTTALKLEDVTT